MNKANIAKSAVLTSEDNRELSIDYYITSSKCLTDGAEHVHTFGVLANMSIDGKYAESCHIDDVSPSEETVNNLVDLLAKNGVTPVTLSDVVNDYLAIL